MSRVFTRYITLARPGNIAAPPSTTLASAGEVVSPAADALFPPTSPTDSVRFDVLNQPSLLARATIPADASLYVRRGCLVALYNSSKLSAIALAHRWLRPWTTLRNCWSLRPAMFSKLTSDGTWNCLIAPNTSSSNGFLRFLRPTSDSFRTLCPLWLDGTSDWLVLGRDALLAFECNTSLTVHEPPIALRRRWRHRLPLPSSRQLLQGRGSVLLSGSGAVHQVVLRDVSDEIVLRADSLLAVNGTSPRHIASSISEYHLEKRAEPELPVKNSKQRKEATGLVALMGRISEASTAFVSVLRVSWQTLKHLYIVATKGPAQSYLKITGPSILLVQSSYSTYFPLQSAKPLFTEENASLPQQLPSSKKDAHLSYATVDANGSVSFRSTPDFSATVREIEGTRK
ncbi:HEL043Wp [Eremothecium sinecaudum]|uniref:Altered inheritance of mitochondria protein 24, mitochondrial n=1 Tax=Eremothecium sinecaudum TaxID=45286 RepID=A0A0X8HTM3_9SACH|nr:HEL043Wp [Eremothecium sinecaudum]AMD21237.1 HEL043Wp [Eremothecium sinecaudum]